MRSAAISVLALFVLFVSSCAGRAAESVQLTSPLTPELREIAETHFANDYDFVRDYPDRKERLAAIDLLEGAFVSLDDDAELEAVFRVTERSVGFCGSVGCFVTVLKKSHGEWHDIGGFPDRQGEFVVRDEKRLGFRDIQSYFGPENAPLLVWWDGRVYRFQCEGEKCP